MTEKLPSKNVRIRYIALTIKDDDADIYSRGMMIRFLNGLVKDPELLHHDVEDKDKAYFSDKGEKVPSQPDEDRYVFILKSCRYNNPWELLDSVTGKESPNPIEDSQGFKRLTHMCIRVRDNDATISFQINSEGVTFSDLFNRLQESYESLGLEGRLHFEYSPEEDVQAKLLGSRIMGIELTVEDRAVGSEYLEGIPSDLRRITTGLVIKAKPGRSLLILDVLRILEKKDLLEKAFAEIRKQKKGEKEDVKRIRKVRVHLKNEYDADFWIDSNRMFKDEYVNCPIGDDHQPSSDDLVKLMNDSLSKHG